MAPPLSPDPSHPKESREFIGSGQYRLQGGGAWLPVGCWAAIGWRGMGMTLVACGMDGVCGREVFGMINALIRVGGTGSRPPRGLSGDE